MEITLIPLLFLLLILILFFSYRASNNKTEQATDFSYRLKNLSVEIGKIEQAVKNEMVMNRAEAGENGKKNREELQNSLKSFGELIAGTMRETSILQKSQLESFSERLNGTTKSISDQFNVLTTTLDNKLKETNEGNTNNARESRKELKETIAAFERDFSKSVAAFGAAQNDSFLALLGKQSEQNTITSTKLDQMRDTVEKKITQMQSGNEKKLDEMRATVDEKLQKTLESRLGESFKLVSERLEAVHKGLGDMQQLATGVGDLKKVLNNVKTRGILGEYQLENILDQILTVEQYAKNVRTKEGSNVSVEFAIKLPAKHDENRVLWLPIDSKFPKADFELLMEAYDKAEPSHIDTHKKDFVRGIKKCAEDISFKYIDPPNTTDFAILFLPFESLYAEVLRIPGLFESIQREYKVIITGPATLSALLNSFQMGFRTLAIEKRSSEVWELLGAVKTEFGTFGTILEKTQKKLDEASNVIGKAGVRSRAIERKLKSVQELPKAQAVEIMRDELTEKADSGLVEESKEN